MTEEQIARIVAFIQARLEEDEQTARAAASGGRWRYEDGDSVGAWTLYDEHWTIASLRTYRYEDYDYAVRMPAARHPRYVDADANGQHLARHDPDRVLRGVAAKRAILGLVLPGRYEGGYGEAYVDVVRCMAAEWDTHPDYDEAWRP